MYNLRSYQVAAKEAILSEWKKGKRKTLLVLPTGSGKTVVFNSIVEEQVKKGQRVLILAHRDELLIQAAEKLKLASNLECIFEKGKSYSIGSDVPVTIGSIQTMARKERLKRFPKDYFDTIIIDEAHHSVAKSYVRILNHFSNADILGVTATPDRGDLRNLGRIFDSVAFEYSIEDAVKQGYLCKVKAQMIPLEIGLYQVRRRKKDLLDSELDTALDPYLEEIALHLKRYCKKRKTVVFLPLIKTAKKFAQILNEHGIKAVEINGETPNRQEVLRDFESGRYNVLCNAMLLTEGWDCPKVDCIVILRPTRIRSLYQQMVGRGMRLADGKDHLLLLDFLWLSKQHDLCRPSSLYGKDKAIARKIDKYIFNSKKPVDLLYTFHQVNRNIVAMREDVVARRLENVSTRKRELLDPVEYFTSVESTTLINYKPHSSWEVQPATKEQLEYLLNRGISVKGIGGRGRAAKLIDLMGQRQVSGLSTAKQIRCLEDMGFRQVGRWTREEASRLIAVIAENNWKIPEGIDPIDYVPGKDI